MDYLSYGQRLAMAAMHGEEPYTMLRRYLDMDADLLTATADAVFNGTAPAILLYRPQELNPENKD